MMAMRMPFGKYKDDRLALVKADTRYVAWLAEQPWFRKQFPVIHAYLTGPADLPVPEAPPKRKRWKPHQTIDADQVGGCVVIAFPKSRIVRMPEPTEAA
jgi:Putative quorum-sensing-regulated virulence factor